MQRLAVVSGVVALLALGISAAPVMAAEIVGNGGFEVAGVGGATDSAMWNEGAGAGAVSQRDSTFPEFGAWDHRIYAGSPASSASVTQNSVADVGLVSLQPGSSLNLSFDARFNPGPGGVMIFTLRILNGVGGIVQDTGFATIAGSTGGAYQTFTRGPLTVPAFGAAPNDVYAAFVEIAVNSAAFAGSTSEAFLDNVHVSGTLTPEPASLALLGLAGLMLRRR